MQNKKHYMAQKLNKLGDIFTITSNSSGHGYPIGTRVRVVDVLRCHYRVEPLDGVKSKDSWINGSSQERYITEKDIENKTTNNMSQKLKFQENDILIVTDNSNDPDFEVGDTVKVISVDLVDPILPYFVRSTTSADIGWFSEDHLAEYKTLKTDTNNVNLNSMNITRQQMKDAVALVAKDLCVANNTVTTLEIKQELRKRFPQIVWNQYDNQNGVVGVTTLFHELAEEGRFVEADDNGTFKTYSDPTRKGVTGNSGPSCCGGLTAAPQRRRTPRGNSNTISRQKALDLMAGNGGRFFTVKFTKKDGTERVLNGQYLPGQSGSTLGYVKVREAGKMKTTPNDCTRNVNLQTLSYLKIGGQEYQVR